MAPIIVPRGNEKAKHGVTFSSRAYQLEMFEESLKKNLIVVVWNSVFASVLVMSMPLTIPTCLLR